MMNAVIKNEKINFFLKWIRHQIECPLCIRCGSYFVEENYFCLKCTNQFLPTYFEKKIINYNQLIQVTSFIQWKKNESQALSELIYLLKTKNSDLAWAWFTRAFEAEICDLIVPNPTSVLVPVPGSKISHHTFNFSRAIQNLTGCRMMPLLQKALDQKNQKSKTAIERSNIQFELNEEFTENLQGVRQIYLIDDVVTTGSTLKNISNTIRQSLSLDQQQVLEIRGITLFYREKSF